MNRILGAVILLASVAAHPLGVRAEHDPLVPEDFAWGAVIRAGGDAAVYEIELPLAVYRGVTRSDLGDLRVFNGRDEVIASAIQPPGTEEIRREKRSRELPFFPVADVTPGRENVMVRVDADRNGAIVEVRSSAPSGGDRRTEHWIVDATSLKAPLAGLDFGWQPAAEPFIERLDVETSDDLANWRRTASGVMASLEFEGSRLTRSSLEFTVARPRYLRLSFRRKTAVSLVSLEALTRTEHVVRRPPLRWEPAPEARVTPEPEAYVYDTGAFLPVERVRIVPREPNTLMTARLAASRNPGEPGREVWRGMIYDLRMGGERIAMEEIHLPRGPQRTWKILPDKSEAAVGGPPRLEMGWRPDRLLFMAAGGGPYRLAFGSAAAGKAAFDLDRLLQRQSGPGKRPIVPFPAALGPVRPLGGEERLAPPPPSPPWQKIVLWCVLTAGVALTGWMALSLLRQLRDGEKTASPEGES